MSVNKKCYLFLILSFVFNGIVFSQFNSNSIYSHYGLGNIDRSGFVQNRALGGLSISMRQPNQINYLNPASYNSQDTMSFIFDIGLVGNYSTILNSESSRSKLFSGFDHLALAFPLTKTWFVSAGLTPFSSTGYKFRQADEGGSVENSYTGSGNLSQFYFGNAFGLFNNHLNFGLNFSYIFGSLNTDKSAEYFDYDSNYEIVPSYIHINTFAERRFSIKGVYWNFGVQGIKELSKDFKIIGGFTFEPRTKLNFNYVDFLYRLPNQTDTFNYIDTSAQFYMPARLGIGISFIVKDKLLIGIDYSNQDWSKTLFPDQEVKFDADSRLSIGIQYIPNSESNKSYFDKINYRLGGFYGDTYLSLRGKPISDYGMTFGFGLPFNNHGNMFNISVEIGRRGQKSSEIDRTNYTRISFSLNLLDFWFESRKLN